MRALLTPIAWLAVSCLGQMIAYADNTVCTLIAEATPYRLVNQTGACDRRVTPASIFKIAISLMGYDAGFLVDETTPALPFKQGYPGPPGGRQSRPPPGFGIQWSGTRSKSPKHWAMRAFDITSRPSATVIQMSLEILGLATD